MINFPIPTQDGQLFTDTDGVLWIADDADLPLQENVRWVRRGSAIGESLAIGAFMNFGGATAPAGYLVCDGTSYKKTDYPDLYAAIGDLWANTGSVVSPPTDEFRVPPQNVGGLGLYLRGDGDSTVVGEYQGDVFKEHNHDINAAQVFSTGTGQSTSRHDGAINTLPWILNTGDPTETRPRSITTLLCIKATFSSFTGDLGNIPVNSVGMPQLQEDITSPGMAGAGYVVESGSNANGEWTKWADGTMICTHISSVTVTTSLAFGNIYRSDPGTVFTYPVAFIGNPIVAPSSKSSANVAWSTIQGLTSSTVTLYGIGGSVSGLIFLGYTATGRWK